MAKQTTIRLVHVTFIPRKNQNGEQHELYTIMDGLIAAFHPDLVEANIALAWNDSWKTDTDEHLKLGEMRKTSDLDKEFHQFDYILSLNEPAMHDLSGEQKEALLDHELSHGARSYDKDTEEPISDDRGRPVFRLRKHDIEEFRDVVKRHGCWKSDLELFVKALIDGRKKDQEQQGHEAEQDQKQGDA